MKKILKTLGVISLLGMSLYAKVPPYKTSLSVEVGGASLFSEINPIYGLSFKMEEKMKNSHFYYGFGTEYSYVSYSHNQNDLEAGAISLYPTISYNFSKDFSISSFAGLSYITVDSVDTDATESKFGYIIGGSINYDLSESVTHGIVIKQFNITIADEDASTTALMYRIGIKF